MTKQKGRTVQHVGDDPPDTSSVSVTDRRAEGEPVDLGRMQRLAIAVLAELEVPADMAVDVLCVEADEIAQLNAAHLDGDGPTDVLAFPIDAPGESPPGVPAMLGDVVLCPEVAGAQARRAGSQPADELDMLLVHGLLHLLGYDHQEEDERIEMFGLTDRLLAVCGGRR